MLFKSSLRYLKSLLSNIRAGHSGAARRNKSVRRRPTFEALEDRTVPSATSVPFKESLAFVDVTNTGELHYVGHATHFGKMDAILRPDNTFTKTAANGDTAIGFVTHLSATTGTVTITGGTGRFEGATGSLTYVVTLDPSTGIPRTGTFTGTLTYDHSGAKAASADSRVVPFKITGAGVGPVGLPVVEDTPAPHNATGTATHLGKYTGEGMVQIDKFTSATTGEFNSAEPFVFVAANGDRLAMHYGRTDFGASTPGTFELIPHPDGRVHVVFVAEFTPLPEESTGRFAKVTGGSFTMIATTDPFVPGSTDPLNYTWVGEGWLEFGKGK